ncbi:hypothetical protein [uncultured Demequina sp.]|uniref:hypothetical protein n=1 Tax=uncultured Demequina sp. TaxID=693499 RepID=UPI0025F34BAD|nr:hypothetical protein [uncultured Demequina sp.]
MPSPIPPERPSPWHAVHGGSAPREAVAPSKPAVPTTGSIPVVPSPIEDEEADVVAPVEEPPVEEIMPSSRGTLWSTVPPEPQPGPESAAQSPFASLGDTAVRNASLAASGAPTPIAGVHKPTAAQVAATAPQATGPTWMLSDGMGAGHGVAPQLESELRSKVPELDDGGPAYTPAFGVPVAETATDPTAGGDGTDGDAPRIREREPWWRSTVFLVVIGLLVLGGIGYGLYVLLSPEPETVQLTEEVLVAEKEVPTLDPIEIADPTAFQAALPTVVGTFVLTDAQSPDVADAGLEARAAEVSDLTYGDGEVELQVRAIQHYDDEAAVAQFEALTADSTDREPVDAGGSQVGERASIDGGIVWRNGTAVFVLTGPADELEDFYAAYPL